MLTRAEKEAVVTQLSENISKAQGVFLTNLIGLPSNDGVKIRKEVREAKGNIVITRNTLFRMAAKGTSCESLFTNLKGPHAVAFAYEDAAAVAKCLNDAGKEFELVELKGGVLDGKELSLAELKQLASLPSRDEMLGTLLATFNAPISALARVMYAIQEQKGEGAPAVEEAPVEA